jgi:hypothetical protein
VWNGSEFLWLGGSGIEGSAPDLAYDPATDTWRELGSHTAISGADPQWVGTGIAAWPDEFTTQPYYQEIGGR